MGDLKQFTPKIVKEAEEIFETMTEEQQELVFRYVAAYLLTEVHESIEAGEEEEGTFTQVLMDDIIWPLFNTGCYFCDPDIDSNETEFDEAQNKTVCLECQQRLSNFVTYLGMDYTKFFPAISNRKEIQKSRREL